MQDFVAPFINATEIQIKQRAVDNGLVINGVGLEWGLKGWMWFGLREER